MAESLSPRDGLAEAALWDELSFLAVPGAVGDWRMILLYEAAFDAGLLAGLPATPDDLANRLQLDQRVVRVVLEALERWGVVEADGDGRFALTDGAPGPAVTAVLRHHARAIHHWSGKLHYGLRGDHAQRPRAQLPLLNDRLRSGHFDVWLDALAVYARASAPGAVDQCLAAVPGARSVLDLGGGHGEYAMEFARRGLQVTLQDRPEIIGFLREHDRVPRVGVELFAGDFFEVLPEGLYDIVFCAGVTYTYDAQKNLTLCRRVKQMVEPGGAFVILTILREADPVASVFAVQMSISGSGADTHSESEYRQWLHDADFSSSQCLPLERPGESLLLAR